MLFRTKVVCQWLSILVKQVLSEQVSSWPEQLIASEGYNLTSEGLAIVNFALRIGKS